MTLSTRRKRASLANDGLPERRAKVRWVAAGALGLALVTSGCSSGVKQIPVTSTAAPANASWAPWPQAQHDAHHSGATTSPGPAKGKVLWKRSFGDGALPAGPVVGNGHTAYLTDSVGVLHAIELSDGKDRWTAHTGAPVAGDLSIAPLVLPDGDIVTGGTDGPSAWAATDGHQVWHVTLGGGGWTSPVTVDGSRIWLGSGNGTVAAVTVTSHRATKAWTLKAAASSYASVVTNGDGRIYTTSPTGLVAIDDAGSSATVAWKRDPGDGMVEVSAGLSVTGIAMLGTNGRTEWAYDRTGEKRWTAPRGKGYSSPSVTADGLAYVAEQAGKRVDVFDVANGKEVGLYRSPGEIWTSVVIDGKHDLYFGTRSHRLVGLRADGRQLFKIHLDSSTSSYPALTDDGHLLIATDSGKLLYVK